MADPDTHVLATRKPDSAVTAYRTDPAAEAVGRADPKAQVRAAWGAGYDAQACMLEPRDSARRKPAGAESQRPVVSAAPQVDPGKEAATALKKDLTRGIAPTELATSKGNQTRGYEPNAIGAEGTNHARAAEVNAYTVGNDGVGVRRTAETRPSDGDGRGFKGGAELGFSPNGIKATTSIDFQDGQRPEDTLPGPKGERAPIPDQYLRSIGVSHTVSGLGLGAAMVKHETELRGGVTKAVPGADGQNVLKAIDGGVSVRQGVNGFEAANARASHATTDAAGNATALAGRLGFDTATQQGTAGATLKQTNADGSGNAVDLDITHGNGTTGAKAGFQATETGGTRVGGSVGGSSTWKVTAPRQVGESWVVDIVSGKAGQAGMSAGKGPVQAGAGMSGYATQTASRTFSTIAEAEAFKKRLDVADDHTRLTEMSRAADPAAMAVGDVYETASGTGGSGQIGAQGGIANVAFGADTSSSKSMRFQKLDSKRLEVRVSASERDGMNASGGTQAGAVGVQSSVDEAQLDVFELDLSHPRGAAALKVLKAQGYAAFRRQFAGGKGTLWKTTLTQTATTETDGVTGSIAGIAVGETGTLKDTETRDAEGNVSRERKGTGGQFVNWFGNSFKEEASATVKQTNGVVDGVTLDLAAEGTNGAAAHKAVAGRLGLAGGKGGGAESAAKVRATIKLTDYTLDLLWRVCATSGRITLPLAGGGEREIGRWLLKDLGSGAAHEKLFQAAAAGRDVFALALADYQKDKGPAGLEAIVRTLKIGGAADYAIENDKVFGLENMLRRQGTLAEATGHFNAGDLTKARTIADALKLELVLAEKNLIDGSYQADAPLATRHKEIDQIGRETVELQALIDKLMRAEKEATAKAKPKQDAARKEDFNGAGAEDAVCEQKAKVEAESTSETALLPAGMGWMAKGPQRNQTIADPSQVDSQAALADEAWAAAKGKKAELDGAWKTTEGAFDTFRQRHHQHFGKTNRAQAAWAQLPRTMHSVAEHMTIQNASSNVVAMRRSALRSIRELEAWYADLVQLRDPQKRILRYNTFIKAVDTALQTTQHVSETSQALLERLQGLATDAQLYAVEGRDRMSSSYLY